MWTPQKYHWQCKLESISVNIINENRLLDALYGSLEIAEISELTQTSARSTVSS